MGQDYRLTQAYEQMLKGSKPAQVSSPKSVTEAYTQMLTERMAFYAKEVAEDAKEADEVEGLKNLGIVDNPSRILHAIGSQTVQPMLTALFDAAGEGWKTASDFDHSLLEPISREFVAEEITSNEISNLVKIKDQLNKFEKAVKNENEIESVTDAVAEDISSKVPTIKASSISTIFNYCFTKKTKIADSNVGDGEIALTLLTNCKKGQVGDLQLPSGEAIEIKTLGGRIGKPSQVNEKFGKDAALFLANEKAKTTASKELNVAKNEILKNARAALGSDRAKKLFHPSYLEEIELMTSYLDSQDLVSQLQNSSLIMPEVRGSNIGSIEKVWVKFDSKGYLNPFEDGVATRDSDKEFVFKVYKDISNSFKNKISKGGLKETIKSSEIKDLSALKFGPAVRQAFFSDYGLNIEQLSKLFMLTMSKQAEKFFPDVQKYFQEHLEDIQAGSIEKFKAAIFALQLSVYADSSDFKYLLIVDMSKDKKPALSLNCKPESGSAFTHLAEKYLNPGKFQLFIDIEADERGGSQVSFRG